MQFSNAQPEASTDDELGALPPADPATDLPEETDDGQTVRGIRPAQLDDVEALVRLGAEFFEGGDYWGEPREFAPVDFALHLIALIRSPLSGFFVAENDAGEVVGAIALIITKDVFSGGLKALKLHWFVLPEYRGLGLRLERRARQWAAEHGAANLTMSAVNEAAAALLERLGYQRTEVLYSKVI